MKAFRRVAAGITRAKVSHRVLTAVKQLYEGIDCEDDHKATIEVELEAAERSSIVPPYLSAANERLHPERYGLGVSCPLCLQPCPGQWRLSRHIKRQHDIFTLKLPAGTFRQDDDKKYQCTLCGFAACRNERVAKHMNA